MGAAPALSGYEHLKRNGLSTERSGTPIRFVRLGSTSEQRVEGGNDRGYYYTHHSHRRVGPIVWRRRLLLERTTPVGLLTGLTIVEYEGRLRMGPVFFFEHGTSGDWAGFSAALFSAKKQAGGRDARPACGVCGGDEGARTLDPRLAKPVLSQLSYVPVRGRV